MREGRFSFSLLNLSHLPTAHTIPGVCPVNKTVVPTIECPCNCVSCDPALPAEGPDGSCTPFQSCALQPVEDFIRADFLRLVALVGEENATKEAITRGTCVGIHLSQAREFAPFRSAKARRISRLGPSSVVESGLLCTIGNEGNVTPDRKYVRGGMGRAQFWARKNLTLGRSSVCEIRIESVAPRTVVFFFSRTRSS